jgi:hypothetical protein
VPSIEKSVAHNSATVHSHFILKFRQQCRLLQKVYTNPSLQNSYSTNRQRKRISKRF